MKSFILTFCIRELLARLDNRGGFADDAVMAAVADAIKPYNLPRSLNWNPRT